MEWENIKLEEDHGIWTLTINRPEMRNALDAPTVKEFREALGGLDTGKAGVLILTGSGNKAFVSGADISDLRGRTKKQALEAINTGLFAEVENFAWPVIGAINGYALGGGCELTLACDIRIASENARFGFPETSLGIIPGAGGTQRLPRLMGLARAKEWVLTGDIYDAKEAERLGLISRVVPQEKLMETAKELARKILSRAPLAVRLAKLALNASSRTPLESGLTIEMLAQGILFESKDKYEGMTAYLEKRKSHFTGE